MALETAIVNLSLATGLAEQIDSRATPQGAFITLQNYVYNKAGALEKRSGYVELDRVVIDDETPPTGLRFDQLAGDLVAYGQEVDGRPWIYSYGDSANRWRRADRVAACTMRRQPQIRYPQDVVQPFISRAGGQEVTTWAVTTFAPSGVTLGGTFLRSTDLGSGAVLVPELQINGVVQQIMSFAGGSWVFVVGLDDAGTHLNLRRFNPATLTVDIFSGGPAVGPVVVFDACPIPDGSGFIVAYLTINRFAPQAIHVVRYDTNLTALYSATIVPLGLCEYLAINADSQRVGVVYSDDFMGTINVKIETFAQVNLASPAGPAVVGPVPLVYALGVGVDEVGGFYAVLSVPDGSGDPVTATQYFTPLAVSVGVPRYLHNVIQASRPAMIGHRLYLLVGSDVAGSSVGALICLDGSTDDAVPLELEAVVAPNEWYGVQPPDRPRTFLQYDADTRLAVAPIQVRSSASGTLVAADRVVFDFGLALPPWLSAEAQGCLHGAGAFLGSFDGIRNVEHGFVQAPRLTLGSIVGGTGSIAGGAPPYSYLYTACYEWVDEQGNVHRSEPSNPLVVQVDAAHDFATVTLIITTTQLTKRLSRPGRSIQIALFRSVKDISDQLYRVDPFGQGRDNNQSTGHIAYSDNRNDADLVGSRRGLIYTDGGVLAASVCPGMSTVVSHKNRLFGAVSEDGRSVWFTRVFVRGEAPAWHPGLSFRLDDSPDEITALASLDDKLLIFTRSRIYWITGDGPNDNGTFGAFSEPFLLTSSSGCVEPRSVVAYEGGVFYRDASGLMRIDRSLQVSFAGAPVQDTIRQLSVTRSAVKDAARERLIWLVARPDGAYSAFVVYDYLHNAWSTWVVEVGGYTAPYSQALWRGKHIFAAVSTPLHFWQEGGCLDPFGTWPLGIIETPWIALAGVGGYERVRRVQVNGNQMTGHMLTCQLSQDYANNTIQSVTWDNNTSYTPPNPPVIRREMHVRQQKVSAIKVRLSDSPSGSVGFAVVSGLSVIGISLEVGVLKGRAKLGQRRLNS